MKYFFKNVAGVVLASQKFNKNVIHSSGGGGFVSSNYGGYVSAPKIYSVNKSTQEIF